jgi:hypothetical protein
MLARLTRPSYGGPCCCIHKAQSVCLHNHCTFTRHSVPSNAAQHAPDWPPTCLSTLTWRAFSSEQLLASAYSAGYSTPNLHAQQRQQSIPTEQKGVGLQLGLQLRRILYHVQPNTCSQKQSSIVGNPRNLLFDDVCSARLI